MDEIPKYTEPTTKEVVFSPKEHVPRILKNRMLLTGLMLLPIFMLSAGIYFGASINKNSLPASSTSLTPTGVPKSSPTLPPSPEISLTVTNVKQKMISSPTKVIVSTQAPTNTPIPPTQTPIPTATPQPPDTTPPTLDYMTGPENGSTVNFRNFCFPMKASDNRTNGNYIQTRYKFDSSDWTSWGSNFAPCYYNIENGSHTYMFEFRDEAGNTSSVTRSFTVQAE